MTNDHQSSSTSRASEMAAENIYDEILSRVIVDVASDIHRAVKTGQLPYSDLMAGSKRQPPLADEAEARGEGDKKPSNAVDGKTEESGANATRGAANTSASGKTSDGAATKDVDTAHKHKIGGVDQIIQQKQDPKEQKQNDGTAKIASASADKSTPNEGSDTKKRKVEFDKASKTTNSNIPPVLVVGTTSTLPPTKKGTATTTTITPLPISPTKPVYTDIYGRTPGKEPRYTIPCPNYPACTRNLSCSRLAVHLEKCLGLPSSRRRNSSSTGGNAGSGSGRRGSSASGGGANSSSAALSNNKSSGTSKGTKDTSKGSTKDSNKGSTKDKDHGRGSSKGKDGKEGSSKGKGKQGKAAKRKSSKIV